jgi:hypothetical protein
MKLLTSLSIITVLFFLFIADSFAVSKARFVFVVAVK